MAVQDRGKEQYFINHYNVSIHYLPAILVEAILIRFL
jgi:hypothetical protein